MSHAPESTSDRRRAGPDALGEPVFDRGRFDDGVKTFFRFDPARPVRYPGERVLECRAKHLANGIPVDATVWARIQTLEQGR